MSRLPLRRRLLLRPPVPALNSGDTAWMLTSSALVLMMTAPGLALFYGGLVRKKNILGVMMQCMFLAGMLSIVWALWGYSLSFDDDLEGLHGFVGGFGKVAMNGVLSHWDSSKQAVVTPLAAPMAPTIPAMVFLAYQGMFFIITPALICGAFAERMKFSTMCVFMLLWGTFIYCPLAHWVWSAKGIFADGPHKAFDFAGGTVVHISSGTSALVCALVLGKRLGYGQEPMPPHNLTYTCIGAGLLWVGWFGFNAGSAVAAGDSAANAFLSTHLASSMGLIAWACVEWITRGKPTVLGACSGAVAGLVCITPACGFVSPLSAIVIGLAGGLVCFLACTSLKSKFNYDDSLDAFGVHGVGRHPGLPVDGRLCHQKRPRDRRDRRLARGELPAIRQPGVQRGSGHRPVGRRDVRLSQGARCRDGAAGDAKRRNARARPQPARRRRLYLPLIRRSGRFSTGLVLKVDLAQNLMCAAAGAYGEGEGLIR